MNSMFDCGGEKNRLRDGAFVAAHGKHVLAPMFSGRDSAEVWSLVWNRSPAALTFGAMTFQGPPDSEHRRDHELLDFKSDAEGSD